MGRGDEEGLIGSGQMIFEKGANKISTARRGLHKIEDCGKMLKFVLDT